MYMVPVAKDCSLGGLARKMPKSYEGSQTFVWYQVNNNRKNTSRLYSSQDITLLTRFSVNIDLVHNVRRFGIPDLGIKEREGQIPQYVASKHPELVDGEMWGIIKMCLMPDDDGKKSHVEMVDFKPFKPYTSVDVSFVQNVRKNFTTTEWLDLIISSMEYEPDSFETMHQKLEFFTRLLIFVEPRLNVVELAPKGTGKSYVFNNISKYNSIFLSYCFNSSVN